MAEFYTSSSSSDSSSYSSSSEYEDDTDSESDENYGMGGNIGQRLICKPWRSYAEDLMEAPKARGIYTIGYNCQYIYVGHSKNIRTRLQQHKHGKLRVDKFIKGQFSSNGGINLQIKWMKDSQSACNEGHYLNCIEKSQGYWPKYNMKEGNTCK